MLVPFENSATIAGNHIQNGAVQWHTGYIKSKSRSGQSEFTGFEAWEGNVWRFSGDRRIVNAGDQTHPEPGDTVVFYYGKEGLKYGEDYGYCGWGVVIRWDEHSAVDDDKDSESRKAFIYFRLVAPSDQLKMCPWGDEDAVALANKVRHGGYMGTLWRIDLYWNEISMGMWHWVRAETPGRASNPTNSSTSHT